MEGANADCGLIEYLLSDFRSSRERKLERGTLQKQNSSGSVLMQSYFSEFICPEAFASLCLTGCFVLFANKRVLRIQVVAIVCEASGEKYRFFQRIALGEDEKKNNSIGRRAPWRGSR